MYKIRIRQWGLDKKSKENEMRAIVRKNKHLKTQGKPSTFRVRGRVVDYKDVVRYWERKGVPLEHVLAQRTQSKTPEAVECFVPLPSPTRMPESITIAERVLVSIRDYFKGSFETGTWVAADPRYDCKTTKVQGDVIAHLDVMFQQCITACILFNFNRFQEAGQSLISATSHIKEILSAEHPMTLPFLFDVFEMVFRSRRYEIAFAILRQFSALASVLVGERHPLRYICGLLASIHPSQLQDIIVKCSGSTVDHFESLAGPMNWSTLHSRLRYIRNIDNEHDMGHKAFLLQDLLRKCEDALGPLDVRTVYVGLYIALHYVMDSDYVEAVRLAWDLIARAQCLETSNERITFKAEGLYIVAISRYRMGETYLAEVSLREAINLRMLAWGPHVDQARNWLVLLEQWLGDQGRLSAAAQVRKVWEDTLQDSIDDS